MDLNFIRLLTVDDVVSYNSLLEKSFSSSRLFHRQLQREHGPRRMTIIQFLVFSMKEP